MKTLLQIIIFINAIMFSSFQEVCIKTPVIFFEKGSVTSFDYRIGAIDTISKALSSKPNFYIILESHMSKDENQRDSTLSRRRSEIVAKLFVDHGVPENRIKIYNYRDSRNISVNNKEEELKKDRRVSMNIGIVESKFKN